MAATAVLLAGCSVGDDGGSGRATSEAPETTVATAAEARDAARCPAVNVAWRRGLPPRDFFPPSLAGLLLRQERCIYLVFARRANARALWRTAARDRVLGLSWAPDAKSFAVTSESGVAVLRRDGALRRRVRATGAAFLPDGRLVVSRRGGIYLLARSRWHRLASRAELERVTGFRVRLPLSVSHDPRGYTRGHGRGAVAITLWSASRSWRSVWKSVVVVVTTRGRVVRASPAFRAGGGDGAVYGWAWSPDGGELFVASEVAGPPERRRSGQHDHCVDVWSAGAGVQRAFCESQLPAAHQSHFAKIVWAADGTKALLDNGAIVTPHGGLAGSARVAANDLSLQAQWEPRH